MCHFVYDHSLGTYIYLSSLLYLTPSQIFFPRSYEQEAGYRYRERPMTELWSDADEKAQLAGGMDELTTAYRGDTVSRMDMQGRDPYAYHPQHASTYLENNPNNDLTSGYGDDASIIYPQRSNVPLFSRPPAPVLDPQDHPYIPRDPTALRSPPPPRPEKNIARRSRAPVWEMVSTDQDEPQEYYVGGPGDAVVRRNPSAGVANLSRSRSAKSNLHPILQNYSSPISTCLFLKFACCDTDPRV